MEHLGGERGRRGLAAPVAEHHRDARRRADPRGERRVGLQLTERGDVQPRGDTGRKPEVRRRVVGCRQRDDPARARGHAHAHAQPHGIDCGCGVEDVHVTRERRRGRRRRREIRAADGGARRPRRPLTVGERRDLEAEGERRVRERCERREQVHGWPPRRPRRQHQQRVGAVARRDGRGVHASQTRRGNGTGERQRVEPGRGQEQVSRHGASQVGKEVPSRLVGPKPSTRRLDRECRAYRLHP